MAFDQIIQKLKTPQGNIGIALLAHCLGFYDFAIFGLLSGVIGDLFFSKQDALGSLISGFGVFSVAYLTRPIGGVVFGYIGDKFGRKKSYVAALLLMIIPSISVGLLPVYSQIGVLAPIVLVFLRLIHGFALGGTFSGNVLYMMERTPDQHRGLVSGLAQAAIGFSFILASMTVSVGLFFLSKESFYSWGWRIPFLFGTVTGVVGFMCKYFLQETPVFLNLKETGKISSNPLLDAAKTVKVKALILMGITLLATVGLYTLMIYYPNYLAKLEGLSLLQITFINTVSGIICIVIAPLSGWFFDRIGGKLTFVSLSAVCVALCSPVVAYFISLDSFWISVTAVIFLGLFIELYVGPINTMQVALFPSHVRSTGMLVAHNLSNSLIGGTSPFVSALLVQYTGSLLAPAYYLSAIAMVSFFTLFFYKEHEAD